jgi:hypothetical protein
VMSFFEPVSNALHSTVGDRLCVLEPVPMPCCLIVPVCTNCALRQVVWFSGTDSVTVGVLYVCVLFWRFCIVKFGNLRDTVSLSQCQTPYTQQSRC